MYIQDINCYASVLYCLLTYFTVGLVHFFVAVLFAICTVFRTIKSNAKQTLANCFLLCLYTLEVIYIQVITNEKNQSKRSFTQNLRDIFCKQEMFLFKIKNFLKKLPKHLQKRKPSSILTFSRSRTA